MSLRDIAARDRIRDNANPMGVAEAVTYLPEDGDPVTIRGVWQEFPNDERQTFGVGVQSEFSGAVLEVAATDVVGITRGATFTRGATEVVWKIDQLELCAGVGWRIRLKRAGDASPKGLR